MRLQPETEIVHRMAIWVHKENCNVHAWRKWASFAVAICARVRFMSWITAKALLGCCTNRNGKQHQWIRSPIDWNRRDMKSKTGKSKRLTLWFIKPIELPNDDPYAKHAAVNAPASFGVETRRGVDGHLNARAIVRKLHLDGKFMKIWNVFGVTCEGGWIIKLARYGASFVQGW